MCQYPPLGVFGCCGHLLVQKLRRLEVARLLQHAVQRQHAPPHLDVVQRVRRHRKRLAVGHVNGPARIHRAIDCSLHIAEQPPIARHAPDCRHAIQQSAFLIRPLAGVLCRGDAPFRPLVQHALQHRIIRRQSRRLRFRLHLLCIRQTSDTSGDHHRRHAKTHESPPESEHTEPKRFLHTRAPVGQQFRSRMP